MSKKQYLSEDCDDIGPEPILDQSGNTTDLGYETTIGYSTTANQPIFTIFANFFNKVTQNKKLQSKYKLKVLCMVQGCSVLGDVWLEDFGDTSVVFEKDKKIMHMFFSKYKHSGGVEFEINLQSLETSRRPSSEYYNEIFGSAIIESNLKGSFITMPPNRLAWDIAQLPKRTFSDIFLPDKLFSNVKLYSDVFDYKELLMRYLLVGVPGSGKTESALVLMNYLNHKGVTIIKTVCDEILAEKVKLAEILAPSLLILDDIDLGLGSRTTGGYDSDALSTFLDVLDGTNKIKNGVGIIATTNSVELLDLAAQRPGRFDKVVLFDGVTKDNIENIILKSLKYEFNITNPKETELYINKSVIDTYYNAKVTGAHIYNSIKLLKLNADTHGVKVDVKWLINEINNDISMIDTMRNKSFLKDKFETTNAPIGFNSNYGGTTKKSL